MIGNKMVIKENPFNKLDEMIFNQIMHFLTIKDRNAFLCTCIKFYKERSITTYTFTSFCGYCQDCMNHNEYQCQHGYNNVSSIFWKQLLKRSYGKLIEFQIAGCTFLTDEHLENTTIWCNLRHFSMKRCHQITNEGLYPIMLRKENKVKKFILHEYKIQDEDMIKILESNAQLQYIDFTGCHLLGDSTVLALQSCKSSLMKLNLSGCHRISSNSIIEMSKHCTKLDMLNLKYCHKITDKAIINLSKHLLHLKELNLRYCYKISDLAISAIANNLSNLLHLNLSQCSRITDQAIHIITDSLYQLKTLRLWGCTSLTFDSIYSIATTMPCLELLDIRSRDAVGDVIGGKGRVFAMIIHTYRDTLHLWEQSSQSGVLIRPKYCSQMIHPSYSRGTNRIK